MIFNQKAFTLPEVLIIVVIISILISLTLPLGLDFYRSQQLETHTQGIIQTLRRAQLKAMSSETDSSFGVYLTNENYTLFQGDSYNTRSAQFDEVFYLPAVLTLTGLSEIVFSKSEGEPNVAGDIILKSDSETRTININEMGRINLQ